MTQPSRVIYLPPGMAPGPVMASGPQGAGLPFDRRFFETILPQAISAFCAQADCNAPVVEVLTMDGVTHYVKNIAGVADPWVALQTTLPDHEHAVQVFVPYTTIFRVGIHAGADERRRRLGFDLDSARVPVPAMAAPEVPAPAAAARTKRRPAAKKSHS
jgi:hypothetical protein